MDTPRSYRLAAWPAADRAAWHVATSTDGGVLDQGDCAHWSADTHRHALYTYGCWLSHLNNCDPDLLMRRPLERLRTEQLDAFVDLLAARVSAQGVASAIGHLINALRAIVPGHATAWLRQLQYRYQRLATPSDKRARMVPAGALYALGLGLMDNAAGISDVPGAAADFRDGLIIVLLITSTLRRKNLAALSVNKHLMRVGERYWLSIAPDEVKTGHSIELQFSARLTPYFDRYIAEYRLLIRGADRHDALWPSPKGGALGAGAIYRLICRRTRLAFGHPVHPHLFRGIAATTIGDDTPSDICMARDLLGHVGLAMTDKHYRQQNRNAAQGRHLALLESLRADDMPIAQSVGLTLEANPRFSAA